MAAAANDACLWARRKSYHWKQEEEKTKRRTHKNSTMENKKKQKGWAGVLELKVTDDGQASSGLALACGRV